MVAKAVRYLFLYTIPLLMAVLLIGVVVTITAHSSQASSCRKSRAELVHVQLGEHVFALPWKLSSLGINKHRELLDTGCFQADDPPLEATLFAMAARELRKAYKNHDLEENKRINFILRVGALHESHQEGVKTQDTYERVIQPWLKASGRKLSSLPKKGDFYVWDSALFDQSFGHNVFYIPTNKNFVTPRGNPVVFNCDTQWRIGGGSCSSVVYWKDGIQFSFEFLSEMHVPKSKWHAFYRDFLSYMESLEIKPSVEQRS